VGLENIHSAPATITADVAMASPAQNQSWNRAAWAADPGVEGESGPHGVTNNVASACALASNTSIEAARTPVSAAALTTFE
jgi:hypothetical protein